MSETPPNDRPPGSGSSADEPPKLLGFEDVPPHMLHGPSGFRVWFTHPLGILTQLGHQTHADEQMGAMLSGPVTRRLMEFSRRSQDKLLFTHDWSRLESYSGQVRSDLTRWGVALRHDIARLTVVLSPNTPTITRMGIEAAAGGLRVAGIQLDVYYDFTDVQAKLALRPHPAVRGTTIID